MAHPKVKLSDNAGNEVHVSDNALDVNIASDSRSLSGIGLYDNNTGFNLTGEDPDPGMAILGYNNTGEAQSITAGRVGVLTCTADGKLNVNATLAGDATIDIGDVDMFLDGGTAIVGGEGTVAAGVLRVSIATDDNVSTKLTSIDTDTNNISGKANTIATNTTNLVNFIQTEDSAHSSGDVGYMFLGVRNDGAGSLVSHTGDYAPLQVNATGALYVDIADGGQLDTIIDTLETTLTAIETDQAAIEALLTTIDADTAHLENIRTAVQLIDNAIDGSEMQVDIVSSAALTVDLGSNNDVTVTSGAITASHDITGGADGVTTVSSAGTDVELASSTVCKKVDIQAQTDNTGLIAVGFTGVDATEATGTGVILKSGDTYSLEINNLNLIYIDSTVSGDGVRYTYFT